LISLESLMTDLVLLFIFTTITVVVVYKSGILLSGFGLAGDLVNRTNAWIKADGDGAWANLAPRLLYRDFYHNTIEIEGGWLYTAVEILPVNTDGLSNYQINELSTQLNYVIAGLPEGTRGETITCISNNADEAIEVFDRVAESAPDEVWATLLMARAEQFRNEASNKEIRTIKQYVLIGRQAPKKQKLTAKIRGLWSINPWLDQTEQEFRAQVQELMQVRETFTRYWNAAGGSCRLIPSSKIMELAYKRLNPERARRHELPVYSADCNPRELLCMTSIEVKREKLLVGNEPWVTVSLHRLPLRMNAMTMERFTRWSELDFPIEIRSHFEVLNALAEDEKLEREERYIHNSIDQQRTINRDEALKGEEIEHVRSVTRVGNERLVNVGFAISFPSQDEITAQARTAAVIAELRRCEGMECTADRHAAFTQYISTLPCHSIKDKRNKRALSREAMGLSCWTNGPSGLPSDAAYDVFHRPDGYTFYFDPVSEKFNAGMFLVCGGTGSGKSALLARLATTNLARGWRGIMLDLNGSFHRLSIAAGGVHLNIIDPNTIRGLALFDIYPRESEVYNQKELLYGIPKDRIADVVWMLEQFCLDPNRPDEVSLEPELLNHLQKVVLRVYENMAGRVPVMDHFIRTAGLSRHQGKERELGEQLAARLSIYSSRGPYGHFFNDQEKAKIYESPLTVFDFRGARGNPRLMQIATVAVNQHLARFGTHDQKVRKFFYVDELKEMTNSRLMTIAIDGNFSTARKNKIQVGAGSQHPEHFDQPHLKAIMVNCETKWLFKMPPKIAMKSFDLPIGVANMLERLQNGGNAFRDCALISPLGASHLRFKFNDADLRLCAPASSSGEAVSYEDAIRAIPIPVPEKLDRAFKATSLGQKVAADKKPPEYRKEVSPSRNSNGQREEEEEILVF
jgi:hypothetical protein